MDTAKMVIGIGVNRPAIVREIPHFGLFPAFPHFCENVPQSFSLYGDILFEKGLRKRQ